MKLIIQIPCFNESATLPLVVGGLPRSIPGIDEIEFLVVDDGSTDDTAQVARSVGVHHVLRSTANTGLASTFRRGLDQALLLGADIIVNIDGDNQYRGSEIPRLVEPILNGKSDIVVGSRDTDSIPHFSGFKKVMQRLGSSIVRRLSHTQVRDTVSGFRAFSRQAALRLTILSGYTYTLETILQVRHKGLSISDVPIATNPKTRESRLIKNLRTYLLFSTATIIRVFTMYNPLRVFMDIGLLCIMAGGMLAMRFLYYYFTSGGAGHIQSLIFAAMATLSGVTIILVGLLADLIQFNRRLLEDVLERVKRIELDR